jgi:GNAT superfamily N-acetyltransferase
MIAIDSQNAAADGGNAPRVELLAHCPHAEKKVAGWLYWEWLRALSYSRRQAQVLVSERKQVDRLPLSFVVLCKRDAVGTASLVLDVDPKGRETPCLAGIYVAPRLRRQGLGRLLCEHAVAHALRLGVCRLGLYTVDDMIFYARLGWSINAAVRVDPNDQIAAYMERSLPLPGRSAWERDRAVRRHSKR